MTRVVIRLLSWIACLASTAGVASTASAQGTPAQQASARSTPSPGELQPVTGPHGGSLKTVQGRQVETTVSEAGLRIFVYDQGGQSLSLDRGRGVASVQVHGNAKRYRYDLLPDGKGGLSARVDLSKIAGYQIEVEVTLIGLPPVASQSFSFSEVATVPVGAQQLIADAIARQGVCPVSTKRLGSMGEPIAVDLEGKTLYLCCAGCVNTVRADPARFSTGRPKVTITAPTEADAAAIARQKMCPVMDEKLGGMGQPVKMMIGDQAVYLCCKGCIKKVQAEPLKYLEMVHGPAEAAGKAAASVPAGGEQVRDGVYKVTEADAVFFAAQKRCPVMDEPLDAMGGPYRVEVDGRAIYICCPGCAKPLVADPSKYLAILASQKIVPPAIQNLPADKSPLH